jgi:hypothetical protein
VVGLYEQHAKGTERIWHAHPLPLLEDEQTTWEPDADWSPNRIDAMVHGARKLGTWVGRQQNRDRTKQAASTLANASVMSGGTGRSPLPPMRGSR